MIEIEMLRLPRTRAATAGWPRATPGRTAKTIPTRTGAAVNGSNRMMVRRLAAHAYDDPRRPVVVVVVVGRRLFSTRGSSSSSSSDAGRRRRSSGAFQLDALPFAVPPSEAYAKFERWARDSQGLGPLLSLASSSSGGGAAMSAAYAPFWYFEMNARFVAPTNGKASHVVPEPLRSAYPNPPGMAIHLPGLASYAGFTYRRTLVDPVHNTAPIFLRGDILPFRKWMLDPLEYDGVRLEVFPDPWNATRERAYSAIRDELRAVANEQYRERTGSAASDDDDGDDGGGGVRVETERLSARRIYMPTYVVDYAVLGISYRAVISGCDPRANVSGVSHSAFGAGGRRGAPGGGALSFLSDLPRRVAPAAAGALQFFGPRPLLSSKLVEYTRGRMGVRRPFRPGGMDDDDDDHDCNEKYGDDEGGEELGSNPFLSEEATRNARRALAIGSRRAHDEGILISAPPGVSFAVGLRYEDVFVVDPHGQPHLPRRRSVRFIWSG